MTWKKNPRVLTKEQFSTGTTIDGNRIDNALDDVVERVNDIPYGDLRKRWVPITYVAGWTPQSPAAISDATPEPTGGGASHPSDHGGIYATHHWPWLRLTNWYGEATSGTSGASTTDPVWPSNYYRLKGAGIPGVYPYGHAELQAAPPYGYAATPINYQLAWTRSWFFENPTILDSINLILEVDHTEMTTSVFNNDFGFEGVTPPGSQFTSARDLVVTASVDSEFAREDRNMSDVEILRKGFFIKDSDFSHLALSKASTSATTYHDMTPSVGISPVPASTIQGAHIRLERLNIPIHQNARLRIAVVIPDYQNYLDGSDNPTPDNFWPNGWNPNNNSAANPWLQQKIHMTVTMLEEVSGG